MNNTFSATGIVTAGLLLLAMFMFWRPAETRGSERRDSVLQATATLGGGRYHVQAVALPGPLLALMLSGGDPTQPWEIPVSAVRGILRNPATAEVFNTDFEPEPLSGDSPGMTSQLVAALPSGIDPAHVEITIPELRIGGERFRASLALHTAGTRAHHGSGAEGSEPPMPEKIADSAEEVLYLTPGGLYTDADIEANGRMTASQRFDGFRAEHDKHPKPGDSICPVTETKANPKAPWIIGGKTYLFCCPPCIDEFLALAKEAPEKILPPSSYVQQ